MGGVNVTIGSTPTEENRAHEREREHWLPDDQIDLGPKVPACVDIFCRMCSALAFFIVPSIVL